MLRFSRVAASLARRLPTFRPRLPVRMLSAEVIPTGVSVVTSLQNGFVPMDGNEAAAASAYMMSETAMIFPITPSSPMGELADEWAGKGRKNIFGQRLEVVEMQSEAGAAGALHGAASGGSLSTTFTSSQGLLLMLPNLFKIAGEIMPCVVHVAARAVAGQALSIFGDHNDIMAVRSSGVCMLGSNSVQEAMDLGSISHLASIKSSLPFIHFFEGFRISHEVNTVLPVTHEDLKQLVDMSAVQAHRDRALNPEHPHLRGTSQSPDVYFQLLEAVNPFYQAVPEIVQDTMDAFAKQTGRQYHLMEYHGDEEAEHVVVCMGSGVDVCKKAVDYANKQEGGKTGVLNVRLYRPFSEEHFLKALPKTVKRISVLDRTKEPGAVGDPLFQEVAVTIQQSAREGVQVIGGRYGMGSKDFTPSMAKSVLDNGKGDSPKNHFTVGIHDDVGHTSLPFPMVTELEKSAIPEGTVECLFWGIGADGTVGANKSAIKLLVDNTPLHGQGYFSYSAHKSGGLTMSHLRFGPEKINNPYLVQQASYVACHAPPYLQKYGADLVKSICDGGTFVINHSATSAEELEEALPADLKRAIGQKKLKLYAVDASRIAAEADLAGRTNTVMQAVFFHLSKVLPADKSVDLLKSSIEKDYSAKGEEIVQKNFNAVDTSVQNLIEISYPEETWSSLKVGEAVVARKYAPGGEVPKFIKDVMYPFIDLQGEDLPVSVFTPGGVLPMGTSKYEKRGLADTVPRWTAEKCSQCNYCAFICPHAALRPYLINADEKKTAPKGFEAVKATGGRKVKKLDYRIQVSPMDCTGCTLCAHVCPDDAIEMVPFLEDADEQAQLWDFAQTLPPREPTGLGALKESQFRKPYLEFSGACAGCTQTTVVKVLTQMYGEKMTIANATGCSSIWAGSFPSVPYTTDEKGKGPAWGNSLFEDNAEYGFGIAKAMTHRRNGLREQVEKKLAAGVQIDESLKKPLSQWLETFGDTNKNTVHSDRICALLGKAAPSVKVTPDEKVLANTDAGLVDLLSNNWDTLSKKSHWIIGGDGWAYDIGFGGLDHVLASGEDVNVLVLDSEVYSNTGGQASKATPRGGVAKFTAFGKETPKKDLGMMMMSQGNVYVGSIAVGADMKHMMKVLKEAEAFPGPSLVIGYASCIAHGIAGGLDAALDEQKLAVDSGYWLLYRYDPRLKEQGKNPLVLDMDKPDFDKLDTFLNNEVRFKSLGRIDMDAFERKKPLLIGDMKSRWETYERVASQ